MDCENCELRLRKKHNFVSPGHNRNITQFEFLQGREIAKSLKIFSSLEFGQFWKNFRKNFQNIERKEQLKNF